MDKPNHLENPETQPPGHCTVFVRRFSKMLVYGEPTPFRPDPLSDRLVMDSVLVRAARR